MPVEITLPLSKLEQAVAGVRANEQVMAAKVEDAKLALKTAKATWEESVGALMLAVDEMINDKRRPPSLFDDYGDEGSNGAGGGGGEPNPPPPAGDPVEDVVRPTEPVVTTIEIIPNRVNATQQHEAHESLVMLPLLSGDPAWRAARVRLELDAPAIALEALETFGVFTMGALADALKEGSVIE